MAKITSNLLLEGLSGKIGPTLVVQKNGIVRSRPKKSRRSPSAEQKKNNNRFVEAKAFYDRIKSDPVRMRTFRKKCKKGQRVYNRIISDYLLGKTG